MSADMYRVAGRARELYGLLQDESSRKVFWARLKCDLDGSAENVAALADLNSVPKDTVHGKQMMEAFRGLSETKKIVLYGTGDNGRKIAGILREQGIDFHGFCGRRAAEFPDGLMGKPVLAPETLFEHPEEYYVQVVSIPYYDEIVGILKQNSFPESHVITYLNYILEDTKTIERYQYFDFMEYFPRGTSFVDGGCYNGATSEEFVKRAGDTGYSKIWAFEPDPKNIARCGRLLKDHPIRNMEVIPAGLSDSNGEARLIQGDTGSHIISETADTDDTRITIRTAVLDDVVQDDQVGMVKMDIEGSELSALHGAERTITRNRPLMAVCVYHKPGDTLAVMDYLHRLVPEYRFALRHYTDNLLETVLYAFVPANSKAPDRHGA